MDNTNNLLSRTRNNSVEKLLSEKAFYILCCVLAILKIWLISGEEIIAKHQMYDQLWHILAAERSYWFASSYSNMTFVHLPVYSIWISLVSLTGVPLRIATELLFLFSGFIFIVALCKLSIHRFLAIVCYSLIIFHPVSFQLFNDTLAETLYAPVFLLALASVIMMWVYREARSCFQYSILSGILLSLLWNLRKENILIIAFLFFLLFLAGLTLWHDKINIFIIIRQLTVMILVPFCLIIFVSLILKTANYLKFGLFVSNEMDAPGYTAAYKALQRINPSPSVRFVPVTKKTRLSAYLVSPSFKELEPVLECKSNGFSEVTSKEMGIPNEIAAGWFYWALRDAAAEAGHHHSAREANTYYQRIADEINTAIDSGSLPGRKVLLTFLDPDLTNYLPYLPDSLLKMWRLFTAATKPVNLRDDPNLSPVVLKAFDIVANRRAALTSFDFAINGWFSPESGTIRKVLVRTANWKVLTTSEQFTSRPDVMNYFISQSSTNVPNNSGFDLTFSLSSQQLDGVQLVFVIGNNKETVVPLDTVAVGKITHSFTTDTYQKVIYHIDTLSQPKLSTFKHTIQCFIGSIYGKVVTFLTYLNVLSAIMLLIGFRSVNIKENIYPVLCFLLFAVLSRIAFFALLDASSWPGAQARYLFPVMTVYSCFLVLFIYQAVKVVKLRYANKFSA